VDLNVPSSNFMNAKYNLQYTPTVFYDGGYDIVLGAQSQATYGSAITAAGSRVTHDLYLSASLEYIDNTKLGIEVKIASRELSNAAPDSPVRPAGPSAAKIGKTYQYTTRTVDVDGDSVYYRWVFAPGDTSTWMGPYASTDTCMIGHAWPTNGTYQVKVLARDKWMENPSWSDSLAVQAYVCGDANGDGFISITDAVALIGYIFVGVPEPNPIESGDSDCTTFISISDAVLLISYVFNGTPEPCYTCP
jgi:hypothetical protein